MLRAMPEDDQIELLRSVLAHAYEKRQPFLLRLVQAVKDYVGPRTLRAHHRKSQHYRKEQKRGLGTSPRVLIRAIQRPHDAERSVRSRHPGSVDFLLGCHRG